MLIRSDILLTQIREESDTTDDNSLSDQILLRYINDAQKTIQNIIFQNDKLNNVFTQWKEITTNSSTLEYSLPNDVFAENSIIGVYAINSSDEVLYRYEKGGFGEKGSSRQYSLKNRKIVLSTYPTNNLLVVYNYRYSSLSKRVASVDSVASQVITVTEILANFDSLDEYVTIVDKYGTQIVTGLYIDSYSNPSLTVEGDLTDVTSSHYVVLGRDASSHSDLPEECEPYLKEFVKRKIYAHINSTKLKDTAVFTQQEKEDIADLFADKNSDIEYPYIVDTDYLDV